MSSRCTGQCCKRFYIDLERLTSPKCNIIDGDQIRDMVILLKPVEESPGGWIATCKHFDGENCTIYENRPWMCRDYPYGPSCPHSDCTYVP